ncbi:hypothetical protein L6164_025607 [Bauhinia variegata]|uniref:Uncharacterized protein n=1 Tax=Bauhinia variegata TaxID=167791 RepID=A0ACB9M2S0_BAUVA|nr:hypothetical protein L6164_025607 [Bauhinia variegata]
MAARSDIKMNAIRSAIVVLGAVAFGYLSMQIVFKPFLEKAQQQQALQQSDSSTTSDETERHMAVAEVDGRKQTVCLSEDLYDIHFMVDGT